MAAQKLDSDLGKVIHITPDGTPVAGNPFIGRPGAQAGNLELWPSQPGRTGLGSPGPAGCGKPNSAPAVAMRVKHHPQEPPGLRLAGDHPWRRLSRHRAIGEGITAKSGMEKLVYCWRCLPIQPAWLSRAMFFALKACCGDVDRQMSPTASLPAADAVAQERCLQISTTRLPRCAGGGPGWRMCSPQQLSVSAAHPATTRLLMLTPQ